MADPKRFDPARVRKTRDELIENLPVTMIGAEVVENRIENMHVGRANIGARNPMVITTRKLELLDPVSSPVMYSVKNLREMIRRAFDMEYTEMFDPKFGSPVYFGLLAKTKLLSKSTAIQPNPSYGRSVISLLQKDPERTTGPMPAYCQNLQKSTNQASTIGGNPIQYRDTSANLTNNGLEFNDPVQGCVADCWLMSALSSIAVAETVVNPAAKKLVRTPPVSVYPPSVWPTKYTVTTTQEFYTDQTGGNAYYGHLKKMTSPSTFYEGWASFYEKCFAGYYEQARNPPFVQKDNPDYGKINYGSAFAALSDITGKVVSTATSGYTKDYFGADSAADNVAGMITKIRTGACNGLALSPNGVVLFTRKPAVAYTYLSADTVPAVANRSQYGTAVTYDCAGMPANHTFSILGLYQKDGVQYIVLRNPWGFGGDTASFSTALQGSLASSLTNLPSPWNVTNTRAEGIFGLSALTFMRYFEAFGWTIGI